MSSSDDLICFAGTALHLPKVEFNETTSELFWTLQNSTDYRESCMPVYLPITGYHIEIHGGRCFRREPIQENISDSDDYHSLSIDELQERRKIESGANYSVRVRSLNHNFNITSNFSKRRPITTQTKGKIIIISMNFCIICP